MPTSAAFHCSFEGHRWIDMRRYQKLGELPIDRPGDRVFWSAMPIPYYRRSINFLLIKQRSPTCWRPLLFPILFQCFVASPVVSLTYTIEYKSDRSKASKHFIVAEVAFEFLSLSLPTYCTQVCDATKLNWDTIAGLKNISCF